MAEREAGAGPGAAAAAAGPSANTASRRTLARRLRVAMVWVIVASFGLAAISGIAVLLVTGQCPVDAEEMAVACLGKPHSAAALVSALKAVETMTCKNKTPRKVSGLTTFWRPEAA